jgi:hypothetical protein
MQQSARFGDNAVLEFWVAGDKGGELWFYNDHVRDRFLSSRVS